MKSVWREVRHVTPNIKDEIEINFDYLPTVFLLQRPIIDQIEEVYRVFHDFLIRRLLDSTFNLEMVKSDA